jgi:hypothetical protein
VAEEVLRVTEALVGLAAARELDGVGLARQRGDAAPVAGALRGDVRAVGPRHDKTLKGPRGPLFGRKCKRRRGDRFDTRGHVGAGEALRDEVLDLEPRLVTRGDQQLFGCLRRQVLGQIDQAAQVDEAFGQSLEHARASMPRPGDPDALLRFILR